MLCYGVSGFNPSQGESDRVGNECPAKEICSPKAPTEVLILCGSHSDYNFNYQLVSKERANSPNWCCMPGSHSDSWSMFPLWSSYLGYLKTLKQD